MYWSMMIWPPFEKSPNWASQAISWSVETTE
jgi:hypothetical protein